MDGAREPSAMPHEVIQRDRERSIAVRAWRRMRQEPSLMFTAAYVAVSCIGLWANYWFYRRFSLPILDYMQASDYLVAGLRDPTYALVMVMAVGIVFLVSWPDTWRRTHPARVERLRARWWGRLLFPNNRWMRWSGVGLTPETGIVLAAIWGAAWSTAWYVQTKAELIQGGRGQAVQVTMAGESAPRAGQARLLGTGGGFVFIWWHDLRRAEAVPAASLRGLRFEDGRPRRVKAPVPAAVPAKAQEAPPRSP